ncbi:hypothetical protein EIN_170780 [Entamoeba invadens IP1]|uniref:J domain-containing protein n=1 Tax=Entamoeba invadens IP1 TaxID=370355 RepID=A0A0A1U0X3_ENTIV|nr:hypothetical protein EIN_170780 [Entamoeba invadens IP1]ELP84543.1 hypothetical protein EIN_170780 [Entamoeba invadens IP1]|eukprot:XP_004183889.1 hypothetical protein EIN_170780 [Entamoeba invadens IP1]
MTKIDYEHHVSPKTLEMLKRVTTYKNPFDIIDVLPEESNQEIRKKYRKISLMCHPDRCHHQLADTAISCLSLAMKALEDEDQRRKYTDIIEQSRIELSKELKERGETIDFKSEEYRKRIAERSQKIIIDTEEKIQRAEKMRQANLKREKEEMQYQQEIAKKKKKEEDDWENSRQQRVTSWKAFLKNKGKTNGDCRGPTKPPKTTLMN